MTKARGLCYTNAMKRHYDENNPYADDDGEDEFEGFTVTDDEGVAVEHTKNKKKKKEESYDDGETVEASAIPENEQTAMFDNAKISGLGLGAPLILHIKSDAAAFLYSGAKKAGVLKPAFTQKLLTERKGRYAECFLYSADPPMVKIKFYVRPRKNTVKVDKPAGK